jgi:CBS domain-containing protein
MSIHMRDLMVTKVITTKKDSTVEEAVKLMNKHEIGCLIVTENDRPIGILTERDLLKRILARSKDLKRMRFEEVMSTPLISVEPNVQVGDASRLMFQKNIKKMPIVKEGELLGLVTLTDILRIQPQLIKMYKILSTGLAPKRIKRVFDYYLLVDTKVEVAENPTANLSPKKVERV